MKKIMAEPSEASGEDRIYTSTKVVSLILLPFLLAAAIILLFFRLDSARLFAWEINPAMTAILMGAGYIGGAYFFLRVITGDQWHKVAAGFPAVAVYTLFMLAATLVHWDRFEPGRLPFLVWLTLYVVTPPLLIGVWLRNRTAHGQSSGGALIVPAWLRFVMGLAGLIVLLAALFLFIAPEAMIAVWPWTLTPLTARVVAGWHALLGAGGLLLAGQAHWSGWRVPLTSIAIWQALLLAGLLLNQKELTPGLLNWYVLYVAAGLGFILLLLAWMEGRRRSPRE